MSVVSEAVVLQLLGSDPCRLGDLFDCESRFGHDLRLLRSGVDAPFWLGASVCAKHGADRFELLCGKHAVVWIGPRQNLESVPIGCPRPRSSVHGSGCRAGPSPGGEDFT